jgi:FkbM family methyltransferase
MAADETRIRRISFMHTLRHTARRLVERLAHVDLEPFGRKSFCVVDPANPAEAWYSYRATLRTVFEQQRVNHVIDVGANVGQFGRLVRSFYSGRMSSFEPVSSAFEKLRRATNGDERWNAYHLALGSRPGVATLHVAERTNFSSFLRATDYCTASFGADTAGARDESVTIRRLDEVLDEISPGAGSERIYLKLDTQGFDLEVFKGLGDKLPRVVAMQSEVSLVSIYDRMPHWTECMALYEGAGFGVAGMFPVNRDRARVIEYDCVLVRV